MDESITKELRSVNVVTLTEMLASGKRDGYRAIAKSPILCDSISDLIDARDSIADRIDARFTRELEAKQAEIDALKADNADLQARLDASIQLPVDADGVPCRIGDLLETEEHIPRKAVGYYLADESTPCVTLDFVSPSIEASRLHHVAPEPPDSQERIDADAKKDACEYFGRPKNCNRCPVMSLRDVTCSEKKILDLLRRQRELDGAGEQA